MTATPMQKLIKHPVVAIWAVVWLVTAGLNFSTGYRVAGLWIGMSFASVAALGAYAAHTLDEARGARRAFLAVLVIAQLALGQWCGWQTLGLNLAQGSAGLDSDAGRHNTAAERLKAAREERQALGRQRPIDAIAAERELECRRTSRTYRDGKGPKCTALLAEEAAAVRAADLDKALPELSGALADAPKLADPEAPYQVAKSFLSTIKSAWSGRQEAATREDALFWFEIFFVALLEFVGTCGPWLFELRKKWGGPAAEEAAPADAWNFGPRRITYRAASDIIGSDADTAAMRTEAGSDWQQHNIPRNAGGQGSPGSVFHGAQRGDDGLNQPLASSASLTPHMHGGAVHGAPITINLHGSDVANGGGRIADHAADANVSRLRQVQKKMIAPPVASSPAPSAPQRPVDRGKINAVVDTLLVFRAACVLDQLGSLVSADDLYAAYRDWAGDRAMAEQGFHTMFALATGIDLLMVGGVPHYSGVVVSTAAQKESA